MLLLVLISWIMSNFVELWMKLAQFPMFQVFYGRLVCAGTDFLGGFSSNQDGSSAT